MQIGVLGTETVAKVIAGKLAALGHAVKLGTRDVQATLARTEPDRMGLPAVAKWLEGQPKASLGTMAEAAAFGEIAFSALSGHGAVAGAKLGAGGLAGKILIDLSNPLDFSKGFPPSLTVSNTDSLGEQIQRELPKTKVVKSLNTVTAFVMVEPSKLAGGDHSMFVCGNDAEAKQRVTSILKDWFGWKDVIDLGDITAARASEMYLPLWAHLMGALKTPNFNVKVVR